MTKESQRELELRLDEFRRESLAEGDWRRPVRLSMAAGKLKDTDPALALRIYQRVRVLQPDSAVVRKHIKELNALLRRTKPELMRSSSNENTTPEPQGPVEQIQPELSMQERVKTFLKTPLSLAVFLPFVIFAFYQLVWASDMYESQSQLIIQQPSGVSTLDPSMALLSGLTGKSSSPDTELVKTYIHSSDLLAYLENEIKFTAYFSGSDADMFSRLSTDASLEDRLSYYQKRISVEVDDASKVITLKAQAFDPEYAHLLSNTIVQRAEWYINKIGNQLAEAQLQFVKKEHEQVEARLQKAKQDLLIFQREYNLLDPIAEGMALQQITYALEGQIAAKEAELRTLKGSMSENASAVIQTREQLQSLKLQLKQERDRLTRNDGLSLDADSMGVNEIQARFSSLKTELEFALEALSASLVSLEKSRIEAYRQLKYLVIVESPTLPEEAKYPRVLHNLTLFLAVAFMLFGIAKIILATVEELR
ncbi:lipopolysaccharide biosynthesis protein [Bowmanella yangjiangensis]|uniref:Lipopolysaccharide biosynthesis protein n=1 Tax=Bowmanella yangjiangensis TaxID=2811230 RepID=A0ABS3CUZ7_9ALTE|nr:lipopolysaccharide biosynthesis protein [Bowmanella yangjiangensis]MBN7820425.1 lipopolysaccharide biosynthesis protein [Bowmanella yangjiangensis]